ncbi:hypothetical protein CKA32_004372 [Geitlerinema sp. FC II]|nr:hypothetical protein CKA32_004372 [Geitlerinema sp. FC II]
MHWFCDTESRLRSGSMRDYLPILGVSRKAIAKNNNPSVATSKKM